MRCFTIASPSPVPPSSRERALSARKNRWKTCSSASVGIPTPVSSTVIRGPPLGHAARDAHRAAASVELDRVVDEVDEHLLEPPPVRDQRERRRELEPDLDAGARCARRPNVRDDVRERPPQASSGARSSATAPVSINDRSVRSSISAPMRSACLRTISRNRRLSSRVDEALVDQVLDERLDRGQRRAQLVRDVGHELAPHALQRLEARDVEEQDQGAGGLVGGAARERRDAQLERASGPGEVEERLADLASRRKRRLQLAKHRGSRTTSARSRPTGSNGVRNSWRNASLAMRIFRSAPRTTMPSFMATTTDCKSRLSRRPSSTRSASSATSRVSADASSPAAPLPSTTNARCVPSAGVSSTSAVSDST